MANLLFFITTRNIRFWRLSLRRAAFVFVLKLKVNTDLAQIGELARRLDLQLL